MQFASSLATRVSLLARLNAESPDEQAWGEFVRSYGPLIYQWCRKRGLQEADSEDVTQQVLLRLAQKMSTFVYDRRGSFRAYLKTVTRYAVADFLADRSQAGTGDSAVVQALQGVAAREDLEQELAQLFDRELLDEAIARVRERVEAHTWEAFQLTALEGLSGAATAARLGIKVATAFKAKNKVQHMLTAEIARLEGREGQAVT